MKRLAASKRGGLKENLKFPVPVYSHRGEMVGTLRDQEAVRKFLAQETSAVLKGSRMVLLPPFKKYRKEPKSSAGKTH